MGEQPPHSLFGGAPIAAAFVVERKGNCGNAEQIGFGGGGHGAGIEGVVAHIRAVVDAGKHPVGLEIGQAVQGEVDAVGGRAVDKIEAVGGFLDAQRAVERERIAGAAAVALGGDHAHVGKFGGHPGEDGEAFGLVAVVVADEDIHGWLVAA